MLWFIQKSMLCITTEMETSAGICFRIQETTKIIEPLFLCKINMLFGFHLTSKGIMVQILADHWNIQ